MGTFQCRGLDPIRAVRWGDEHVVAHGADIGDDDGAIVIAQALAPNLDDVERHALCIDQDVPVSILFVLGTQRVAKEVGRDLAGDVVDTGPEAGHACGTRLGLLDGSVELAVSHRVVVKDLDDHLGRRQGQGMDGDLDQSRIRQGHSKVLAVDLVAVRQDRNQVVAVRQGDGQVVLGALGDDGGPAGGRVHPGPIAAVGIVRVSDGIRGGIEVCPAIGVIKGVARVILHDLEAELGYRVPLLYAGAWLGARADHLQAEDVGLGRGLQGRWRQALGLYQRIPWILHRHHGPRHAD